MPIAATHSERRLPMICADPSISENAIGNPRTMIRKHEDS